MPQKMQKINLVPHEAPLDHMTHDWRNTVCVLNHLSQECFRFGRQYLMVTFTLSFPLRISIGKLSYNTPGEGSLSV
jgi:hypothetical protein